MPRDCLTCSGHAVGLSYVAQGAVIAAQKCSIFDVFGDDFQNFLTARGRRRSSCPGASIELLCVATSIPSLKPIAARMKELASAQIYEGFELCESVLQPTSWPNSDETRRHRPSWMSTRVMMRCTWALASQMAASLCIPSCCGQPRHHLPTMGTHYPPSWVPAALYDRHAAWGALSPITKMRLQTRRFESRAGW